MLKQWSYVHHPILFEWIGQKGQVRLRVRCDPSDTPVVHVAFHGEYERSEMSEAATPLVINQANLLVRDVVAPGPYQRLFTRPDELRTSPYHPVLEGCRHLRSDETILVQTIFQPVRSDHDWHGNIRCLLNLEYAMALLPAWHQLHRFGQQTPANELRSKAEEALTKAHADKPLFGVGLRLAVGSLDPRRAHRIMSALEGFLALVMHGGRPLGWLDERDYLDRLGGERLDRMLVEGNVYRPGMLMNSSELASWVHLPPAMMGEARRLTVPCFDPLVPDPHDQADEDLRRGTPIGVSCSKGREQLICIPASARRRHAHLIGNPGTGKSTTAEGMALADIARGEGAMIIDPHSSTVANILRRLPAEHADRVIYLNPGDPQHIPLWNPLASTEAESLTATAKGVVRAFKGFLAASWGDRLERLLRHAVTAVLRMDDGSLADVATMLVRDGEAGKGLRERALALSDHPNARLFWSEEFSRLSRADLNPAQNKLGKLLDCADSIAWMLSQPESRIDLPRIMAEGQVLLVDLGQLDPDAIEVLGSFLVGLVYAAAPRRKTRDANSIRGLPESYRPFHVFCDEAHLFVTDAVEQLLAEVRKFNVSFTMIHQHCAQLDTAKRGAITTVGSSVVFRVNASDAEFLKREMRNRVEAADLIELPDYQAIARLGNQIIRINTIPGVDHTDSAVAEAIRRRSRELYCRPIDEVRRVVRERHADAARYLASPEVVLTPLDTAPARRRSSHNARQTAPIETDDDFRYSEL